MEGSADADTESVHDLRVASRRLASALRLWQPVLEPKPRRKARLLLRRIRQSFGPVRDLEVHLEAIKRSGPRAEDASAAIDRGIVRLERRLRRALRKAGCELEPKRVKRVTRSIGRAFEPVARQFRDDPEVMTTVRERLHGFRQRAIAAIGAASTPGLSPASEHFHLARVAIKKWRYAAERLGRAAGRERPEIGPLRELQEILGDGHDRATLHVELTRWTRRSSADRAALEPLLTRLERESHGIAERFRNQAQRFLAHAPHSGVSSRGPSSPGAASRRGSSPGR